MVALELLEEQIDAKFDVEEVTEVDRYSEKTIYLPDGEKTGFIDLNETPWAREPINSLVDPEVAVEAGIYGTQMAKTTQATCVALSSIGRLRQQFVWMWPKEAAGRKFSKSRFQRIINASPDLRALKPDNSDLFTNLELHFKNGGIGFFVGSHSAVDQKSSSVPLVIVDEIEDIAAALEKETDPITSINERSKTFTDRKLFLFGSCLLESGPAWQQYLLGDQRHYLVPCPHCGTRQALEFRGPVWLINRQGELEHRGRSDDFRLWWDPAARIGEHEWDYEAVRASACYVCAECSGQIKDHHKRAMLAGAAWHATAKAKVYGHRSRRINSLYPLWASTSFANFAIEFLNSRVSSKKLQNFRNNWEAKPWSTGLDLTDKTALGKRLDYLVNLNAPQGERVGARSLLLVDVQRHCLIWAHFSFGDAGGAHLVDCGVTRDFDSLREIDDKLATDYVALDARYRSQEVYEAVHARRGRWIALRGEKTGAPLSVNYNFDPFTGDKAGRQGLFIITLVHLNTYTWGEEFLNRLYPAKQEAAALPGAKPGAASVSEGDSEAPRIRDFSVFATFPKQLDFVTQLFSEYLIDYIDAKNRPQRKWKESSNNHLFDLCKYAYAIGSFLGLTRIAADARKAVEAARAAAAAAAAKEPELPLADSGGGVALFRQ